MYNLGDGFCSLKFADVIDALPLRIAPGIVLTQIFVGQRLELCKSNPEKHVQQPLGF